MDRGADRRGDRSLFATFVGWLSVRTEGIYTIMITLAIGVSFYYLAQQNYSIFGGHQGFNQVHAPVVLGVDFSKPVPYYYLALFWALAGYFFIKYLLRAPFGVALQGTRENPRRMNALGFDVAAHRIAAYAVAGRAGRDRRRADDLVQRPHLAGTVSVGAMLNILIIAVLGGMRYRMAPMNAPIGWRMPPSTAMTRMLIIAPVLTEPGEMRPLYQTISTPPTAASTPATA